MSTVKDFGGKNIGAKHVMKKKVKCQHNVKEDGRIGTLE